MAELQRKMYTDQLVLIPSLIADLPPADQVEVGTIKCVTDVGVGDTTSIVISDGSAWVDVTTAATVAA